MKIKSGLTGMVSVLNLVNLTSSKSASKRAEPLKLCCGRRETPRGGIIAAFTSGNNFAHSNMLFDSYSLWRARGYGRLVCLTGALNSPSQQQQQPIGTTKATGSVWTKRRHSRSWRDNRQRTRTPICDPAWLLWRIQKDPGLFCVPFLAMGEADLSQTIANGE